MKTRTTLYWVFTGLTALAFAFGGVMDLLRPEPMVQAIQHLGYPSYFLIILGTWKLLGAVAIAAPRLPLLKEWAYAGMLFDLTGAALSHAASGDDFGKIVTPLVLLGVTAASWYLRPEARRLAGRAERDRASSAGSLPANRPAFSS
jgi:uncharacterized membrane protein YphA (DoxX/SURF4 family)